ncbi:hypothetical protein BDZ91DRAFT_316331 [Kalaharituber pfeilii]|nr:hypothetical protein BDZ91DRAFT_316331 [Kalaharituber pfeilii]
MSIYPSSEVRENWPEPNYDNPDTRAPGLRAGVVLSVAVAAFIVALRIYTRLFIVKTMGIDDYLISAAMIISMAVLCVGLQGTQNGWGVHVWDLPKELFAASRHYSYLAQVCFVPITTLTKFSILYSYLRISPNLAFQCRVYFLGAWVALWCCASFFALVFRCYPVRAYWVDDLENAHCINSAALILASGALNTITDLTLAFLPAPMLWKARLPKKERGGLVLLFAFAGTVCVVGVARWGIFYDTINKDVFDCTWGGGVAVILGMVENNTGIIGASLPALRPFCNRYCPSRRQSDIAEQLRSGVGSDKNENSPGQPTGSPDLERGTTNAEEAISGVGGFYFAATTPFDANKSTNATNSTLKSQCKKHIAAGLFKNSDSTRREKQSSKRSSITTRRASFMGAEDTEVRRVPTGRTWLSLDDEDEDVMRRHRKTLSDASIMHSYGEKAAGMDIEVEQLQRSATNRMEQETRQAESRSPTPPLPPGIEISKGAFCFAATPAADPTTTPAPTPTISTAKSSKASLRLAGNEVYDSHVQIHQHNHDLPTLPSAAVTASSSYPGEKRRETKRWIAELSIPFISGSRSRQRRVTLESTDTIELGKAGKLGIAVEESNVSKC